MITACVCWGGRGGGGQGEAQEGDPQHATFRRVRWDQIMKTLKG